MLHWYTVCPKWVDHQWSNTFFDHSIKNIDTCIFFTFMGWKVHWNLGSMPHLIFIENVLEDIMFLEIIALKNRWKLQYKRVCIVSSISLFSNYSICKKQIFLAIPSAFNLLLKFYTISYHMKFVIYNFTYKIRVCIFSRIIDLSQLQRRTKTEIWQYSRQFTFPGRPCRWR